VLNLRRVVLERTPVAGADLDHPSAQAGECLATELAVHGVRAAQLSLLEVTREARLLRAVERRFGEPQYAKLALPVTVAA
jgi:hypothetical protein